MRKMISNLTKKQISLTVTLAFGAASFSIAQESAQEAKADQSAQARVIEEVVVTATKRGKSERDIPVSIDAFNGDDLTAKGADGAQSVLLSSPGVSVNQYYSPSFVQIQVRGTTTSNVVTAGATPVGAFLDDIPLANPSLFGANPNIDAFDLASVEVLKGPQGTLFGGSTLAGALRSVPNEADPENFSARLFASQISIENSDTKGNSHGAMLNLPLGAGLAVRGMITSRENPGVVDDVRNGQKDLDYSESEHWRGMLTWALNDRLTIKAMVHEADTEVDDILYTDNPDRLERSTEDGLSPTVSELSAKQLKFEYSADVFSVVAATATLDKVDTSSLAIDRVAVGQQPGIDLYTHQVAQADAETHEVRVLSSELSSSRFAILDRWEWLLGVFAYKSDQKAAGTLTVHTLPLLDGGLPLDLAGLLPVDGISNSLALSLTALNNDTFALAKERAVYFDATRDIGETWELNIGGRFFRQEFSGAVLTRVVGITQNDSELDNSTEGFNPKLAVTKHLFDGGSVYASITKGFRFGGVNIIVEPNEEIPPFYDSDELWNYEVGLRTDLFDNRLRFDLTAYYIDWSRIQISQRSEQGLSSFIENGGSAKSQGAEVNIKAILTENIYFTVAGAYTDARTASAFMSELGPISSGSRLPSTPYWTGSSSLEYMTYFGPVNFTAGLSWVYQGESFNDLIQTRDIPAYDLFSLNVALSAMQWPGSPQLGINVANLTNEQTYNNVLSPINGVSDYFPIRPRSISMQLQLEF